ncbi:hypothetical protein, partial [Methylogaea oryzae]
MNRTAYAWMNLPWERGHLARKCRPYAPLLRLAAHSDGDGQDARAPRDAARKAFAAAVLLSWILTAEAGDAV